MTDNNRILDKIKKCLALSESPEPYEAAAALRQAQKLMEIHGISQTDLRMADIGETAVQSKVSVSKVKKWELMLMSLVAKSFGCQMMWRSGSSYGRTAAETFGNYIFIGLKAQVPVAEYTAIVLLKKLIKARAAFTNGLPVYMHRSIKTTEADGFCTGWVQAIAKTISEFVSNPSLSQAIDDYKAKINPNPKMINPQKRALGQFGYDAGRNAAAGESLNRPMGNEQRLKIQ